jgi:stearoyl-CoA desaturase (delta-9 desaturase)
MPMLLWNESFMNAYFVPAILRYVFTLHATWLVNSIAHVWGWKPYDTRINPVENLLVSLGAIGEGFHNYHHTFPQDYATSEFGAVYFNFTKGFIDCMALLGQAYDLKKISPEQVKQRRMKHGDLSDHNHHHHNHHDDEHEHDY